MILEILKIGDPRLNQESKSIPTTQWDKENLTNLLDDLIDTMYNAQGIGIAAVQVGIMKRIFVIDIPKVTEKPIIFINPTITKKSKDLFYYEEGCLSIPGVTGIVGRPRSIQVKFQDIEGNFQELLAHETLSICIQHELDHLDGILFIERISPKESKKIKEQLESHQFPVLNLANRFSE